MQKIAFFDRDGTLNIDHGYISRPDRIELYDDVGPVLRALSASGYKIVVITNQSGIARGYFTENELDLVNKAFVDQVQQAGGRVDLLLYCPHHPQGIVHPYDVTCDCRKPGTDLLKRAVTFFGEIDLQHSFLVGDKPSDVEAADAFHITPILIDRMQASAHHGRWRTIATLLELLDEEVAY